MPVVITIGGVAPNEDQAAALREALGIPEEVPVSATKEVLAGADEIIIKDSQDGGAFKLSTISAVTGFTGLTAPDAFTVGQWTATAGDEEIVVNIAALPSNGGSAITALEYRLDGGTAVAFTGTGTGSRTITGLTNDTEYDIEIRAVNAIGNGAWSDLKARTPAAVSGFAIVQQPAPTYVVAVSEVRQNLTAVGSGNGVMIGIMAPNAAGDPVSVLDSAANSWGSPVDTQVGADQTTRFYRRANITDAITWVEVTFAGDVNATIGAVEASGGGASISADEPTLDVATQGTNTAWTCPFTSTVDNVIAMMFGAPTSGGATVEGVSPLTAWAIDGGWGYYGVGLFPTAGPNTAQINLNNGRNGNKYVCTFRPGA